MSHFVGLCFGVNWEDNLDRYYEGLEVEAYIVYTKEEAIDHVKQARANNYEFAVDALRNPNLDSGLKERYQDIVDRGLFIAYEDAWKEAQDWGYEIDEDENLLSTYNPESKWDWYSVGGRWDGFLHYKNEELGFAETNEAYIHELDMDYLLEHVPFCFVTEDGEWREKGEMGWWGSVSNEKPEDSWKQQFVDYVKSLDADCLVTVVDFHI
jgi:hypothetical protein